MTRLQYIPIFLLLFLISSSAFSVSDTQETRQAMRECSIGSNKYMNRNNQVAPSSCMRLENLMRL